MRLLTFVLNALWEEACRIENGIVYNNTYNLGNTNIYIKMVNQVYSRVYVNRQLSHITQIHIFQPIATNIYHLKSH